MVFIAVLSACVFLLPEVSARPTHELTTGATIQENVTLLDSATNVTNFNVNVEVATTNQVSSNLTAGGNMTASFIADIFSNVSHSAKPLNTPTHTYESPHGSIDVSKSDITEVTTTESPKTTTGMDPVPTIVRGTTSPEVPMHTTGSNTDSVEKHTYKGRRRFYEIVLRMTLTDKETEIGGSANLKIPVQDSWVEDPKDDPEPNTDTTSAATVTTGSSTPPPTPLVIDAESMAGVRMYLTDAKYKASDALENYGNHPAVLKMRALQENEYIPTLNFAASLAFSFPLLPALNSTTQDTSQQERLMLVDRESRILQTLSRDLLRLEKSHVTRHGGECGGETSEVNINYFCHETLGSMNQLTDALCDFHHKLAKLVSSSSEEDPVNFLLPEDSGNANLVRYHVLSGLYQIQRRTVELETILEAINKMNTYDYDIS